MNGTRKIILPWVCLVCLAFARPAHAGFRDWVSPSKNWQRIKNCCGSVSDSVSNYCHNKVEKAKADQAKMWGLRCPETIDPKRPLVVMIHGLDSNPGVFNDMARLMKEQGVQSAYFGYPDDGPIDDAVKLLNDQMGELHAKFPELRVSIVAHSMGSLVARGYIEGDHYVQAVDHFIAMGPPNHGSTWTRERWLLELHEHFWLWRTNKDWSPIWMFTDGTGQAGDDLKAGSAFLKALNARPRRDGVKYTIIVGNQHILARMGADGIEGVEHCLPQKNWWGLRQTRACLTGYEERLRDQKGGDDGVVQMVSAQLDGVGDVVTLHADHNALAMSIDGKPPVAWETIKARLAE